jgi:alkylation response protein AidB-like acyl-CoA dehydrogenase
LQPLIRQHAQAAENNRRLTPDVHAALLASGVYRMTVPPELGAPEVTLPEAMRVLEVLAEADGSTAWSVWAGLGAPAMAAFMPDAGVRELFGPRDAVVVGSVAAMGRAVAVEGGYRVSGRWPFASNVHHATGTGGLCLVFDGDEPRLAASGQPVAVFAMWPISESRIIETWDTTGLRGTGSDDIEVTDLFVPAHRVADFSKPPRLGLSRLHYLNVDNAANVTVGAIAIGIANAALAAFRELAPRKKLPNGEILGESALGRLVLASTQSTLAQARGHLYEVAESMSEEMAEPTFRDDDWLPRTSLTTVAAVDAAIEVVSRLYREAATSAIFRNRVLDRCLRDIYTLGAHKTVQHTNLMIYGGQDSRLATAA